MSILNAIQEKMESLHLKERALAEYLIKHPRQAVQMTITELAAQSGSSTATISRFCKTFHSQNFPDFKQKLATELVQQTAAPNRYQDIVAGNPLNEIVSAITANHLRSITDTTQVLDLNQLRLAIEALHRATRIDLYGSATSGIVAQDFFHKLIRIGKAAAAFSDPHLQLTSAASLTSEDVAVGISYSGETPETIHALRCAAEQGATTLSITRFGANTLADHASVRLFTSSAEVGMRRGDMASRMATLHVVDILFIGLVSEHFEQYVPRLELSYQTVKSYTSGKEERKNK
ncbi:MurR/RpiR family transcriptional regulator [Cohnella luojiensis]|uniref:MurR/RpiR family transcriptional regulator n=1 Tax=Cohnella luojiensis TaxID=652876 RepID=A0A4Y8LVH0_9BACL|nr:MurR/RpiR family transcriptional regulator [Cohnella luojiensis]TFE25812.1 MurR/RpiR family transcriptional regulator [Cohnella luojiensis]